MTAYMNRGRAVLTFLYVPLALILWFSRPLMSMLGQKDEVAVHSQTFMRIALPGVFCYSQFNYLRRYLTQNKITKMPLAIILATTSLHFLWCHLFVIKFKWGI